MRSGLLPYIKQSDGSIFVCLFYAADPVYSGFEPQIAKGHIEAGESPFLTAIREGNEELGYNYKKSHNVYLLLDDMESKIKYHAVEIQPDDKFGKHSPKTKSICWMEINEACQRARSFQQIVVKKLRDKLSEV